MKWMAGKQALIALWFGVSMLLGDPATAQDFPSRPIRWIVPYFAGTAPDATARIVAEALTEVLHQPVVIDNKAGASGNIGAQIAVRAASRASWPMRAAAWACRRTLPAR